MLPKRHLAGVELTRIFVDVGMSPLCERYVAEDGMDDAQTSCPLYARLRESCLLVQIPVSGEAIFSDDAYFSSYSDSWLAHARKYAEMMIGDRNDDIRRMR